VWGSCRNPAGQNENPTGQDLLYTCRSLEEFLQKSHRKMTTKIAKMQ